MEWHYLALWHAHWKKCNQIQNSNACLSRHRDITYEVNFELTTYYALNHREGKLYEYTLVIPLTCSTFKVDSSSTTPWLQSKVANMYVHCISHSSSGLDWSICLLWAKYIHSVILFNYWTNSQTNYAALQHTAGLPSLAPLSFLLSSQLFNSFWSITPITTCTLE